MLPCPLYIVVTLAVFHAGGKVPVSMQWLLSRLRGKKIAGAAIFRILAPRPSDPAALWDDMGFSNSSMLFGVMCGIVNCGLLTLSAVRSLMCLRRARDDECDGRFRSSSRGCFINQRFRRSAMSTGSVINLASSFSWCIGDYVWLPKKCPQTDSKSNNGMSFLSLENFQTKFHGLVCIFWHRIFFYPHNFRFKTTHYSLGGSWIKLIGRREWTNETALNTKL